MDEEMHWRLTWLDLAPSRHPFDPDRARALIAAEVQKLLDLVHGRTTAITPDDRALLFSQVGVALLIELGAWTCGWTWVSMEEGGPVRALSGALTDYAFRRGERDGAPTVERMFAAVMEWRAYLEALEKVFDELPQAKGRSPDQLQRDIEQAGAMILPIVVRGTETARMWYQTFTQAMLWYLEAKGHDARLLANPVGGVVATQFESWVAPPPAAQTACFTSVGSRVLLEEERASTNEPTDALTIWLNRGRPAIARFRPIVGFKPEEAVHFDAQRRYVDDHDRRLRGDAARADAMEVALDLCRESTSKPLSFDLLQRWQEVVLGEPAPLRTTDAFAKKGRERYGTPKNLREQLEACLSEANDEATPLPLRAARVYLDVLFFHPFADGNARAARLALDHTLMREGVTLHAVEPIFALALRPTTSWVSSASRSWSKRSSASRHERRSALTAVRRETGVTIVPRHVARATAHSGTVPGRNPSYFFGR